MVSGRMERLRSSRLSRTSYLERTARRICLNLLTGSAIALTLTSCEANGPTEPTHLRADGIPAFAAKVPSGYEVLSFGFDVAPGSTGVLEVACPAGKVPTGGGFHFPTSNSIAGPDVVVIESSPRVTTPGTTGWRVVANNRTAATQRMEVWVVCVATVPGYRVLSFGIDVAPGNTALLEVACRNGTVPTGGGFHFPNSNSIAGPDVVVIESSPRVTATGTTGWRVVANNRTAVSQRMEAWVVCAKRTLPGYEVLSFGFDVAPGNTGVLEVACPAGKVPTGGGFNFPNSNSIAGPDVVVIESSPRVTVPGTTGWRVAANNRTNEVQRMEVWVVCAAISQ
jgi:hypothetical protein